MDKKSLIKKTAEFAKQKLSADTSGHDWWHTFRVWQTAKKISAREKGADFFVVEAAALLHDIADHKFHGGDDSIGPKMARMWLEKNGVEKNNIEKICGIIENMSFNKEFGKKGTAKNLELQIVQDADRLDALGAIGVARTIAYGGYAGREMYNPAIKPKKYQSSAQYKKSRSPSVNHFYEKILLLKNRLNTRTAKRIAAKRHRFLERFLEQFFREWNGKDF